MLVAVEDGVDILVTRALLRARVLIGGKEAEAGAAQGRAGNTLHAAARHQVETRAGHAGGLQQRTQKVFVDVDGRRLGAGIGCHQLAREENRIDLPARCQNGGHILIQGVQPHGLLLLIRPAQADIGDMEGGKFFHCCKTFTVQPNLTGHWQRSGKNHTPDQA